ncbi:MAG: hypothetical protein E7L01_04035 [Paenibacillus macerans]|uniref:Uncharacterized protein n=1 Tax=Paenibacillus macerans TaxID=44252 RepID=A0A6N8EXH2_PAEMA|nr:hypothetical protein [Paenibacillus macerans]MBS5912086.1 hypothetical protein [Paenibacillus macerans]MDU5947688.1 hypothetical protein [Paenibacillus macerans]MDU7472518.1 hypothetical protein [Paenibacillus macerans]MEC0136899.1 hypothetical protein [Paenibacillus macerans]MUG24896.1 hypothetical protein [Paenibacillus macerans]
MKTGLFIRKYDEVEWEKMNKNKCVFLGSEGCIYKLPHKNEIVDLKNKIKDMEIHIITPLVSQMNLQLAKDAIDDLISANAIDSITFNDYGVLYYVANKYKYSNIKFYLGRLLTKSFSDCPWSDHLNRNEEDFVKKYMNGFALNDPRKIKMFKDMGIEGAHLSANHKNAEGLKEIAQNGFDIIVHLNTIIGSSSRICSQAQYHSLSYPACKDKCEKPAVLRLSKVWSLKEDGYIEPSKEVKRMVPDYYVAGNITYYRNPDQELLLDMSHLITYGVEDSHFGAYVYA